MLQVELITAPGCSKCVKAKENIKKVIKSFKNAKYKEINILDHPELAVKYKIMNTPAIIINGKLVFDHTPTEEKLRNKLNET